MPIYEYSCDDCRKDFELLIRADENPVCPSCQGRKLQKRFSVPAAHSSASKGLPTTDMPRCSNPPPGGGCGRCFE